MQLRYRCRLESFEETPDGVRANLVDLATGAAETVDAEYLVGCDGATSRVRRALGIALAGKGLLGHAVNMFFRAPQLIEACGKEPGTFFLTVDQSGVWANLRIIDPAAAMWRLMVNETDANVAALTIDKEAYLRRGLGRDFPVEWIGANVWHRQSVVAESYGRSRVFLAGDAVHQVSPTGALGMNTGMGDAIDLGWKLAAVLKGWGGAGLLLSYDAERRPVGRRNVAMATAFHSLQTAYGDGLSAIAEDSAAGAALRRRLGDDLVARLGQEFRTMGLQLGYRYEGSPICVPDSTPPPPDDPENYLPSSWPGARAPHAWLGDGSSILDLYARDFVLLRFGGDAPAAEAFAQAAAARGVPLRIVAIDDAEARRLYERRLVLVRPDGHVAWRSDAAPEEPLAIIDRLRGASRQMN